MKDLTKKLFTLIVALLMVVTNVSHVFAISNSDVNKDKATITVEKVEDGTTLNLYKIVEPDIDPVTDQMKGYKFTTTAGEVLIDPKTEVTLTLTKDLKTYTIKKLAKELDADGDGVVDAEIELASETVVPDGAPEGTAADTLSKEKWTVGTGASKALYDMEAPTQTSINLAVVKNALGPLAVDPAPKAEGKDYIQQLVSPGQYIGLLVAPNESETTYNPVVLSAGYKGLQKYRPIDTATHPEDESAAKFYKKVDGTYTSEAPAAINKHLYEKEAWDSTKNNGEGGPADPKWVQDGTTTIDQLIAGNVDPSKDYGIPQNEIAAEGTKALAKKSTPDMVKEATTDYLEEGKPVPEVATLPNNGDPKYVTAAVRPDVSPENPNPDTVQLVYIKAPFSGIEYNNTRDGNKFYKLVNGEVKDWIDGTDDSTLKVQLTEMETLDAHLANTVPKNAYSAGQGERIDYKLSPTIPQYPLNAKNKTLTFTDKMGEGISFVPGSIEISFGATPVVEKYYDIEKVPQYKFYVDTTKRYATDGNFTGLYYEHKENGVTTWKQVSDTDTPDVGAELYELVAEAKEQAMDGTLVEGNNFQINFKYDAIPGTEGNKVSPVIKYNAVINEKAICGIPGNVNVAKMFYAKNSGQGESWNQWGEPSGQFNKEQHDEGKVYTYEIKFRKTNDKEEYVEDENGTLVLLKELNASWTDAQKARYNELLALATPWYKVNSKADQYGRIQPEGQLIALADANQTADDVFYNATPKYKSNVGEGDENFKILPGAIFGLYKTAQCNDKDLITKIEVNAQGFGHTTDVHGTDTYYLKEIKAPTGYSLNTTVYPVTPEWTSASTWSTDTVTRYVYSVVEYTNEEWADTTKHRHTGWLVTKSETDKNGKFYDMNGNANNSNSSNPLDGKYFGDGNGDGKDTWVYDYGTKTMTKGNVVVKYVFPAISSENTKTTTYSDTVYNNNGGTLYIARINNTKTSELPSTGGIGTYLFTIAGVAIIATAAFMLIFRKKEGHNH